jgi:glyoxylase-like metal-dependent hydrolase (beta-lactamase superfamily II)
MIVATSMHPDRHSNSYLVADEAGGHAVFIDAGAPIEPLMTSVDELDVRVTHVLLTHEHHDHTTHLLELEERYGAVPILPEQVDDSTVIECGSLQLRALETPGHCTPHVTWLVETDGVVVAAFTGGVLFRGTVGSTIDGGTNGCAQLRTSIVDKLLTLPDETVLYPGHMHPTTVAIERETNPFVRAWRGDERLGDERIDIAGNSATLLFETADDSGETKAWVRFDDGNEAIVGGSIVTHAGAHT